MENKIICATCNQVLKNNETKKQLKELIMNRRHLHISIFFLVQTYLSIERDIRKLFSNCFIFRCSKKEMETIADELIETSKDYIHDIVKIVFDEKYNFLFINNRDFNVCAANIPTNNVIIHKIKNALT